MRDIAISQENFEQKSGPFGAIRRCQLQFRVKFQQAQTGGILRNLGPYKFEDIALMWILDNGGEITWRKMYCSTEKMFPTTMIIAFKGPSSPGKP